MRLIKNTNENFCLTFIWIVGVDILIENINQILKTVKTSKLETIIFIYITVFNVLFKFEKKHQRDFVDEFIAYFNGEEIQFDFVNILN